MRPSYWQRRLSRHLLLAVVSAGLTAALSYALAFETALAALSTASAYAGLTLLIVSLSLGPLNILRNRPNPVSTDLRRDVGIWAGLLGLLHTILGLQVHMGGKFWLYFLFPPDQRFFSPLRYDAFGLANYMGLIAVIVLIVLLTLSNNFSLRRLGQKRWKKLQRWNYAGFALVAGHGALYQFLEKREVVFVGLFGAIVVIGVAMQLAGYGKRRARESRVMSPDRSLQAK
jgi:methionine sulfoxide reductase heme-binding subunit